MYHYFYLIRIFLNNLLFYYIQNIVYKHYFYKFYIPAKYDQTVNFKLIRRKKSSSPDINITCYEYYSRQAIMELRKERTPFSYYYEPHYYTIYFRALNSQTKYIAFELKPSGSLGEVDAISYILSPTIFEYDQIGRAHV